MISFRNIASVSTYELKTLYRSWFFRIFSIIALFFLFGINMGFFGFWGGAQWTPKSIPANVPYINILFVNVAQAIIAVFLASDFLKRDKKLDTTEVIYTRPVSNGEYVVGKTLGILVLFVGLVGVGLLMGLIFNIIHVKIPIAWEAYIYYLLLITLPTLVFILGLSFLMMILIKNQAVTFVVLLGYIGVTLFYFKDKLHGVLDYMAFNLPMVYSDFIGFAEPDEIILHRLAYLLMGIGFIFATIRFLNRLPQVGRWNSLNTIGFLVFTIAGAYFGYSYYSLNEQKKTDRAEYLELNNRYADEPTVDIVANNLGVVQKGRRLQISSSLTVRNRNREALDTLIFSLNPGFRIDSITSSEGALNYLKEKQILKIIPANGLARQRRFRFTIQYSGMPTEDLAYLDISEETYLKHKRIDVAPIDKKAGIFTRDYMLLTPEVIWYPVAGVRFNTRTYMPGKMDFVRYSLSVKPANNLVPVAPGEVSEENGLYHFRPENDLNALSLTIGPFEKRSLVHEGVEYNLYIKPGHDFFSEYITNITDTIPYLIHEEKEEYEVELDLYYSFKRINLVEVPVQFHPYERPQVSVFETVQPEMLLMPEKGAGLNSIDFARYKFFEERRNRRQNETRTDKEIEVRLFQRFLSSTFFRTLPRTRPMAGFRGGRGEDLITYDGVEYDQNPYCVFPLYYSYMTGISSPDFPLFNSMMEIYLKQGFSAQMRQAFRGGMSDNEIANRALRENTISEIFEGWDNTVSTALISQVGSFVFYALQNRVGISEFDNFLYYYLEDNAFREISLEQFSRDFNDEFGVEIEPYFETVNTKGKAPAFLMSSPEYILTRDEIGEVYLVKFMIRNIGEIKGLVDVTFRVGGGFGGGGGNAPAEEKRLYEVDAGVTKEVQVVLYEQPRMMTLNTLISSNIPSSFSTFLRSPTDVRTMNVDEYDRVSEKELTLSMPGEIIVDNEDPGFSLKEVNKTSKVKQYINSLKKETNELEYQEMMMGWMPWHWTPMAHSAFYGEIVRSAYGVNDRSDGESTATWKTVLPAAGFYDVYVFIPRSAMIGRGDRGRGGEPGQRRGPTFRDERAIYKYVISSNEGTEEVEFPLRNTEDGWNKIGAFHFPADTAIIVLSNDVTNGNRVIADAVKWVRR